MRNAIILAAGKSNRFAPFTYEKPKGLFRVKGEVLIERQIEQLHTAGIQQIIVVVGYMKEKFFYLEDRYGVKLISNNQFGKKGNLLSLYEARAYLSDTYLVCADQYYSINPFLNKEMSHSYRACTYYYDKFNEFAISVSNEKVITSFAVGGENSFAMVGHAYFNKSFSESFVKLMENEINDFGVDSLFWEEFYARHINRLTLYAEEYDKELIREFDCIEDLCDFDSDFLMNVDSDIVDNICKVLLCKPKEIENISVINAGLTNVSFAFEINGNKYVYRHPGGTAGNLIDREAELFAQKSAKELGIDDSMIYMDTSGWKISYYVEQAHNCDFEKNDSHLQIAMNYLHLLHSVNVLEDIKVFDNVNEAKKLMKIASATKGNLEKEFADLINKVDKLYSYIKEDANKLGYDLVLCHNDTYAPNYLYDCNDQVFLIDWEYAGLNYAANDICCILCRYNWTDTQIERYLRFYFERDLSKEEHRFYIAFIPICAFYWFCWGLYKGSVGDDDSFFFLPAYRNLIRFIDIAIKSYED